MKHDNAVALIERFGGKVEEPLVGGVRWCGSLNKWEVTWERTEKGFVSNVRVDREGWLAPEYNRTILEFLRYATEKWHETGTTEGSWGLRVELHSASYTAAAMLKFFRFNARKFPVEVSRIVSGPACEKAQEVLTGILPVGIFWDWLEENGFLPKTR